jgi:hypothetical protein
MELLEVNSSWYDSTGYRSFHAISVIEGEGCICGSWPNETSIKRGESVLIPACAVDYVVEPAVDLRVLKSYVPDLSVDVVEPLISSGVDTSDIVGLGGSGKNDLTEILSQFQKRI